MDSKRLTESFTVSSQITVEDVSKIKMMGFRSVMCNRPDGEGSNQTAFKEIENTAKELDLAVVYLPVKSGSVTHQNVQSFEEVISKLPSPIFAYCRSGARCETLWSLARGN